MLLKLLETSFQLEDHLCLYLDGAFLQAHSKLSLFQKNLHSYSHQEHHNSLLPMMPSHELDLDAPQYLFAAPNSNHFFKLTASPTLDAKVPTTLAGLQGPEFNAL
uniref:Uncharacterized protein n=1 Tax=Glycine max TaxID=3847 RepID=C6TDN8_SOYBN|nr:unknown [Glycine max]